MMRLSWSVSSEHAICCLTVGYLILLQEALPQVPSFCDSRLCAVFSTMPWLFARACWQVCCNLRPGQCRPQLRLSAALGLALPATAHQSLL